jgi:4'-phosphopantetheinyl transferase EntD
VAAIGLMKTLADIESLFLVPVAVEIATNSDYLMPLAQEEAPFAERMIERRRQEFAAGRASAHRALRRLGAADAPIRVAERREPVWPQGVVGSITHCEGFCAAVVGHATIIAGLGIDAEPARALDLETRDLVLTAAEQEGLSQLPLPPGVWATVGFVAKEALFKAIYPRWGREIAFEDVLLDGTAWPRLKASAPQLPDLDEMLQRLELRAAVVNSLALVGATLRLA